MNKYKSIYTLGIPVVTIVAVATVVETKTSKKINNKNVDSNKNLYLESK